MSTVKDKVFTILEMARLKGVSSEYILAAITNGELKATYFHGEWHIRESSYNEYEKNCRLKMQHHELVSLGQASKMLKIPQKIILRAIQNGIVKAYEDNHDFKILLKSLLEWDRRLFPQDRYVSSNSRCK